jgi:hypothetical protein
MGAIHRPMPGRNSLKNCLRFLDVPLNCFSLWNPFDAATDFMATGPTDHRDVP